MRALQIAALFLVFGGPASAAPSMFSYRGELLVPQSGSGVPGVRRLRFTLSGAMPERGACSRGLTIVRLSDGAYSLKKLLKLGFTISPGSKAEVCRDAQTDALTERLDLQVVVQSGDQLVASYAWKSRDPAEGRQADVVTLFANIEYHVSAAKMPGRLMTPAARK